MEPAIIDSIIGPIIDMTCRIISGGMGPIPGISGISLLSRSPSWFSCAARPSPSDPAIPSMRGRWSLRNRLDHWVRFIASTRMGSRKSRLVWPATWSSPTRARPSRAIRSAGSRLASLRPSFAMPAAIWAAASHWFPEPIIELICPKIAPRGPSGSPKGVSSSALTSTCYGHRARREPRTRKPGVLSRSTRPRPPRGGAERPCGGSPPRPSLPA